jgi:ubiquinol-cytochrome c reductase cytochrome b subunit
MLGDPDNWIPANPMVTPPHIVPEWYFLPFYAILRAVPDKLTGVLLMFGAIGLLFVLPWIDRSKTRSMRYRPTARLFFLIFVVDCLLLGLCGSHEPDDKIFTALSGFNLLDSNINSYTWLSRVMALYYYAFYVVLFVLSWTEKPLPVPESISAPVLKGPALPHGAAAEAEKKG